MEPQKQGLVYWRSALKVDKVKLCVHSRCQGRLITSLQPAAVTMTSSNIPLPLEQHLPLISSAEAKQ